MKIAIPVWNGFVSSVFDFAHSLLIVDVEGKQERRRSQIQLEQQAIPQRVNQLVSSGIDVIICGAISRPLAETLTVSNIKVIPFVSGSVDEVLEAYLGNRLAEPQFLQPGCWPGVRKRFGCGGGHRHRRGAGRPGKTDP
ncbi:MAG: dinitrogenase iron-molybdenum cofactor biosynthesis protein [Phycisphaerae bacterium]|nr:dinitrogenase iron-molybdenum cofactor biosynthesis protein [Phycisphaerae bacterium]